MSIRQAALTFGLPGVLVTVKHLLNCGRKEEPAVLISRLLLNMHCMYVASIHLNGMHRTSFNLMTRIWTLYHS